MKRNIKERIESRIKKESSGCWLWTGCVNNKGYGSLSVLGRVEGVHRAYWSIIKGPIPEGNCVCHICDVPACVNPEHLFLGTYSDNMLDKIEKGHDFNTNKTHCKRGHLFNEKNTRYHTYKNVTGRHCRECEKLRSIRRRKLNG